MRADRLNRLMRRLGDGASERRARASQG